MVGILGEIGLVILVIPLPVVIVEVEEVGEVIEIGVIVVLTFDIDLNEGESLGVVAVLEVKAVVVNPPIAVNDEVEVAKANVGGLSLPIDKVGIFGAVVVVVVAVIVFIL